MSTNQTLRGLTTISFYSADIEAAKKWYTELLGISPYFERPGYVEFRIGDYQHELGIIDRRYVPKNSVEGASGAVVYWHVNDVEVFFKKLVSSGAKEYEPITKRGEGFITASVIDPFGNILGIMYNRHYLDMLSSIKNH